MRSDNLAYEITDTDEDMFIDANGCYRAAELKAADYYRSLCQQVAHRTYIPALTEDFRSWKDDHIHHHSILSGYFSGRNKPDQKDYHRYIQWLDHTGKLDAYLDRSISYIFMRDLGKALDSSDTRRRIRSVVDKLKEHLTRSPASPLGGKSEMTNLAWLYRKARKDHIEGAMIWVLDKLKTVSEHLPEGMDAEQAERKLIKIIMGVLLHESEEMGDKIQEDMRSRKLDEAIRLGYSYGLTYPFIDDLLDAKVLTPEEKKRYSDMIRTALVTGSVPELGLWPGKNAELVRYIHGELSEAFEFIKAHQSPEHIKTFFEQAYVFFRSQEEDRQKELSNTSYTNEELYIPIILKSSSSRLIARSVSDADEDSGFDNRTFYYGIYNQLADDFADMYDDLAEGAVTPYTYYLKYRGLRPDLINPFELYWTVISNLIRNVYYSDPKTREVILDRAVNGLKRYRERMGPAKYSEVMAFFTAGIPEFNLTVQKMVQKADDVDFFDKLLRDRLLAELKKEKTGRADFEASAKNVREQINRALNVRKAGNEPLLDQTIVDAANYSLSADGKRIRPLVAWTVGKDMYGLEPEEIMPVLNSLEYMHTASLIFDDLPSQDNADMRRGRPALHKAFSLAEAELAGLFLTQKAVEEQASLKNFDPAAVLKLIRYSSGVTQDICKGQAMDLGFRGSRSTLEQLNTICFYKTGLAFEASLVMPAILARAEDAEIEALKKFARYAGIAFQIKDDLLDAEGDPNLLGKATGKDTENRNSTFVTILGLEDARREMWNNYCSAMEALDDLSRNTVFLSQLLNYVINRVG